MQTLLMMIGIGFLACTVIFVGICLRAPILESDDVEANTNNEENHTKEGASPSQFRRILKTKSPSTLPA
jgi:hypothetical protein